MLDRGRCFITAHKRPSMPNSPDPKRHKGLIHIYLSETRPAGATRGVLRHFQSHGAREGLGQTRFITPRASLIDVALDFPRLIGGDRSATQSPTKHIIGQRLRTCLQVESSPIRHLKSIPRPTHTPVTFPPPPHRMEPNSCLRVTAGWEHQPRS